MQSKKLEELREVLPLDEDDKEDTEPTLEATLADGL